MDSLPISVVIKFLFDISKPNLFSPYKDKIDQIGVNYQKENGDTLLHIAARYSSEGNEREDAGEYSNKNIEFLIGENANPNIKNNKGETPLLVSLSDEISSYASSLYLIGIAGADINAIDNDGNNILHLLIDKTLQDGYPKFLDYYLKNGADPTMINKEGKTPIDLVKDYQKMMELNLGTSRWPASGRVIQKYKTSFITVLQKMESAASRISTSTSSISQIPTLSLVRPTLPTLSLVQPTLTLPTLSLVRPTLTLPKLTLK